MLSGAWYDQYKINILPHLQLNSDSLISAHSSFKAYLIAWSWAVIKFVQVGSDVKSR